MLSVLFTSVAHAGKHKDNNVSVVSKGEPEYLCPEGWNHSGKMCSRLNHSERIAVCAEGMLINGQCELSIAAREVCPDGYSYDGLTCVMIEQIAPVLTECPDQYVLKGGGDKKHGAPYCERSIMHEGPWVCPQGTQDTGKNCVTWHTVYPMYECPHDTLLEGQFCVSHVDYDCSPHAIGGGKKKHLRLLGEKKHDNFIVGSKGYEEEHIIDIHQTCRKTIYDAAIMKCPNDAVLDGKSCKYTNYHERIQEKGILSLDTLDVDTYCPMGNWCSLGKKGHGSKKHGDQCCQYFEERPFFQCPMGYELQHDRCVAYTNPVYVCKDGHKKHKKGGCSTMEYKEPIVTFKQEVTCVGKDCGHHKH